MQFIRSYLTLFLLFLFVGSPGQNKADDLVMGRFDDNKRKIKKSEFAIKTDILTPPVNYLFYHRPTISLSFEYGFCRRHAIQLTEQYGTYYQSRYAMPPFEVTAGQYLVCQTQLSQSRAELILDYKYYWKDSNNFKGFYSGLYLRAINYHSAFKTFKGALAIDKVFLNYGGFGGGVTMGYQYILKKHLTFDFLLGLGVRNLFFNALPYDKIHVFDWQDIPEPLRTERNVDIRTTVNIGYLF